MVRFSVVEDEYTEYSICWVDLVIGEISSGTHGFPINDIHCNSFLMRKAAAASLFSSMARCRRVCWHPSGPGPQPSVSTPCLIQR